MTGRPMPDPLVELRGIVKAFPGAVANAGIDLAVYPGEVLAILGENGAGKSTLMSILAGLYRPDAGTIAFDGRLVDLRSPGDAVELGIGMVHQHFRLVESFTVAENVLLGWDRAPFLLNLEASVVAVERLARDHGLAVDPRARIWQLSVGERQRVEILKMLHRRARLLVLDEPTAVLTPQEIEPLFAAIRRLAREGRSAVFISHKLDEVLAIADRIVVLRAGRVVGETRPSATTPRHLAQLMVGHDVAVERPEPLAAGPPALVVEQCSAIGDRGRVALYEVTLEVRRHEILGIAGVAGSGQRELLEVIAGLRPPLTGRVSLDGGDITRAGPRERWRRGIAYVPEDRLGEGLVPSFTVTESAVLRDYCVPPVARGPLVSWAAARAKARALVAAFQVRTANEDARVQQLSGGTQQRLLLGREALGRPRVLIAMYPTRGLDVEATAALHRVLFELRAAGSAIVLVSESLDELLSVADRLAVLHRGRIAGVRPVGSVTREEIGLLMAGAAAA
ncbi:MAG TPA: ABC transporter ATP-binding protein [Candidatus Acidoferrum sp.]|nr:ABC transporter ATP-binding protein [Candidatus Acidoferrum sp.]